MSTYTQANRPLAITTPLGPDVLLLTGLKGHEGISEPFRFELELVAEDPKAVVFEKILGQGVTAELELPDGGKRYVNGIVSRFRQGRRDGTFAHYRAEVVPKLWLLTRTVRSRVFQQLTVPEILAKVFAGLVVKIEVSAAYEPRDYCTQYRESDFAFASRLMEEEGIRYYFRHSSGSHQLVVTDDALEHPDLPGQAEVPYDELNRGGDPDEMRVTSWEKSQEVRSDTWTLRDHSFELPGQVLEAQQKTLETVPVGEVTHRLCVVDRTLEQYDFPGGYAQRFDGVDPEGAPRPSDLQKVFPDRERTVRIRMEAEEMLALSIEGTSDGRHFCAGFAFTLARHFDGDGRYLITRVEHAASLEGDYRSGGPLPFSYRNTFRALPAALAFRPARRTPKPVISGNQTATVVAPPGEEIWCDRYGRVKVLFHWDREHGRDPSSSCWIRVAQPWAGNGWGFFFWPRAGNEVVVSFEEGDPDQPLVVGSVYNAENMPYFALPAQNKVSGIKSASVRGFAGQNFNGVVFHDAMGFEHLAIHSERTLDLNAEWDKEFNAGRNRHENVSNVSTTMIGGVPSGGGGGGVDWKDWKDISVDGFWYDQTGAGKLGLEQKLVVGESLTGIFGLSQSVICGSQISVRVNPTALSALGGTKPSYAAAAAMGAGYGGSLSLNLGANTTINVGGPNINIKDRETTNITIGNHRLTKLLCLLVAIVSLLWEFAYAITKDAKRRTYLYYMFQPLLALLLWGIVSWEMYCNRLSDIAQMDLVGNPFLLNEATEAELANEQREKQRLTRDANASLKKTLLGLVAPIVVSAGIDLAEEKTPHVPKS